MRPSVLCDLCTRLGQPVCRQVNSDDPTMVKDRAETLLVMIPEVSPLWSDSASLLSGIQHDGVGQIGSETTINSGDIAGILMVAVQALEKRTAELKQKQAQIAVLESRLEALEQQKNHSIQIAAEVMP
jgi:hypothetical protein